MATTTTVMIPTEEVIGDLVDAYQGAYDAISLLKDEADERELKIDQVTALARLQQGIGQAMTELMIVLG